jgi:hypothetical protein
MRSWYVGFIALSILITSLLAVAHVSAASSTIVVSEVQLGTVSSASNEIIELYNNASTPVDISNWCLYYASASSMTNGSKLACFTPSGANIHDFLPANSYALAISTQLASAVPTMGSDIKFSATLAGTAGHIRLISDTGIEVDKIGWGVTASSPEGTPAGVPTTSTVLQRKSVSTTTYQDTDNNSLDFSITSPRTSYSYGALYEIQDLCSNIDGIQQTVPVGYSQDVANNCLPPPTDICPNITGLQVSLPTGFLFDDEANCQPDSCLNITGLQISVPDGMDSNNAGDCYLHDSCLNLPGTQTDVPVNFSVTAADSCVLDILPLVVNELLPNPTGTDSGNEFIEIYNPNDVPIDTSWFNVHVGLDLDDIYSFPVGTIIQPGQYFSLSSSQVPFTLVNTSSQVALELVDGTVISQSDTYVSPADGEAWALIGGIWQYTNQPTPGALNLPATIEAVDITETASGLQPCATNQYRSPDTNRCRLISSTTSLLTPCKDGQYRSEVTNRCRSLALDGGTLTPCKDNQVRSEETNRCRDINSTATTLKPCADNQYRSETTHRCRNIVQLTSAPFPVQPVASSSGSLTGWWVAGGVASLAFGYAAWEWRREFGGLFKKAYDFVDPRK